MDHHQHAGVVGQLLDLTGQRLHVEELLHLRQHLLLGHPHHGITGEAEPVEHGHDRLAPPSKLRHQPRQVVFQERFAVRCEHADGGPSGGGIGGGQAEEQPLAADAGETGETVDAESDGAVLLLGKRLGVDDLENDVALGSGRIGIEQRVHPPREGCELRRLFGQPG